MKLIDKIRNVPDFPIKGIQFKDITTLLQDPKAFKAAIDEMVKHYKSMKIDKIVSQEARGFIFGGVLAYLLGAGFVPIRKPKKLPYKTVSHTYEKEYGKDEIHMHVDAVKPGENVLLFDDLLATGGTALAGGELVKQLKGNTSIQLRRVFPYLKYLGYQKHYKKFPSLWARGYYCGSAGHVSQDSVKRYILEQNGKDVFDYNIYGNPEGMDVRIGNFTQSKLEVN